MRGKSIDDAASLRVEASWLRDVARIGRAYMGRVLDRRRCSFCRGLLVGAHDATLPPTYRRLGVRWRPRRTRRLDELRRLWNWKIHQSRNARVRFTPRLQRRQRLGPSPSRELEFRVSVALQSRDPFREIVGDFILVAGRVEIGNQILFLILQLRLCIREALRICRPRAFPSAHRASVRRSHTSHATADTRAGESPRRTNKILKTAVFQHVSSSIVHTRSRTFEIPISSSSDSLEILPKNSINRHTPLALIVTMGRRAPMVSA